MGNRISGAAGQGLALVFGALKKIRPVRPIHPNGISLTGTVEKPGTAKGSGISWIDTPGTANVRARLSRSVGLPPGWPDILGLALRISSDGADFDILLASTGMCGPGRYLLAPRRRVPAAKLTTLMPYKGPAGPVQLAARTLEPDGSPPASPEGFRRGLEGREWTLGLYYSGVFGTWTRFATLRLTVDPLRMDTPMRFDPVQHPLPGARIYEWTRQLREPSYAGARKPR